MTALPFVSTGTAWKSPAVQQPGALLPPGWPTGLSACTLVVFASGATWRGPPSTTTPCHPPASPLTQQLLDSKGQLMPSVRIPLKDSTGKIDPPVVPDV